MANPANNWIQRYQQDQNYQNWVTNTWGDKAYGADGVVDHRTHAGIVRSYGNAQLPRRCAGPYDRRWNSRHNANNAGVHCCSKWRNGFMGDNVNEDNNLHDCGHGFFGNPEQMNAADLEPPPPPPPPVPAWMVALQGYGAFDKQIGDVNIHLVSGADFIAMDLDGKFGEIYDIYLNVCGDYPVGTEVPEADVCHRCSALFNGNMAHLPEDPQVIANITKKLNNFYYELHRRFRTNYNYSLRKFKDEFIRLCNTISNAAAVGGNKNKKSRRFLRQRVNKTRRRTTRRRRN